MIQNLPGVGAGVVVVEVVLIVVAEDKTCTGAMVIENYCTTQKNVYCGFY